jgi:hypothetical protein
MRIQNLLKEVSRINNTALLKIEQGVSTYPHGDTGPDNLKYGSGLVICYAFVTT